MVNVDEENASQILPLHNQYTQKMKVLHDINAGQMNVILEQTEQTHSLSMDVITWSGKFTNLKNNFPEVFNMYPWYSISQYNWISICYC